VTDSPDNALRLDTNAGAVTLRQAVLADAQTIFDWRNLPEIVSHGTSPRQIPWQEHRDWFQKMVASADQLMLIIGLGDKPIGQVRFDRTEQRCCRTSIYLVPPYIGRGLGVVALKRACWEVFATFGVDRIEALIRHDNPRSVSAFRKAGFVVQQPGPDLPPAHVFGRLERPPQVPHNRLTHDSREAAAVARCVESGQWAGGPAVERLESALADLAQVEHAVAVGSGLAAIRLALLGFDVQPGDRVLIPAYSCVALANAVLACGAVPVPVDVQPQDWNIDPAAAHKLVSEVHPVAAIAVNTFGAPADVEAMADWGIPVIEDCAHAFGLHVNSRPLGGRSPAAISSFYATKLLGGGEGGVVLTDSDELARHVRSWRDYSDRPCSATRLNDKMTDLAASLVCCQLERLDELIAARRTLAKRYDELLSAAARSGIFRLPDIKRPSTWYRYCVELTQAAAAVVAQMASYGVRADEPVYDWRPAGAPACPVADRAYYRVLSLPLYPTLTAEEQERTVWALLQSCREPHNA
jgi:perosamine synthetase